MGIYISGVKGLPEQVQENKENIKTIQDEIEGIDFDEIRALEDQVVENTQDINNIEGTIGTQNIAITNLGGRVDTLEAKTSEITKSATTTNISGTTTLFNVVVGSTLATQGDIEVNRSILMSYDEGSKMELDINSGTYYGFNNDEQVEIHSDGDVYKFTSSGITLNDNPIGGGSGGMTTYINDNATGRNIYFSVNGEIETKTHFGLRYYLHTKGITSEGANPRFIPATGHYTNNGHFCLVIAISTYSNGLTIKAIDTTDNTELSVNMSAGTYTFLEV